MYDRYYGRRAPRWPAVLAAAVFLVIVVAGGLVATNYKHFGNMFKVIYLVKSQYLEPVETTALVDGAIRGMVESLEDPYSVYLDPKTFSQLQDQIRGSFGGLGILVGIKDELLTVIRSYEGTPAAEGGIQAGDVIVAIDDIDARGIDLDTAITLMRGPVGSRVELTIERGDRQEVVKLAREQISVPTVEGKIVEGTGIGHIMISQFTEKTPEELNKVLHTLQAGGMTGLILDLRDNPGGELKSAVKVADNFMPAGPVVFVDYRTGRDESFNANESHLKLPLVVLINGGSASAAEIVAGAVKDSGSGILVGTKTFGKGIVQTVFPLEQSAGLKMTTARYLTPSGQFIHEKGIEPNVVVEQEQGVEADLQLERAIELINGGAA
ncbi:MAG: S41 family peptidase [Bacillota bacterium]|jgi:carboxyl-terminal processing protease